MKCDKYKFIFIDICKNAGTSISASFVDQFPNIIFEGKHHSIKNYTAIGHIDSNKVTCSALNPDIINDYFLFSVIRNPWDRMVSLYLWGVNRNEKDSRELEIWWRGYSFEKFIKQVSENKHNEYNGHRYKTQLEWVSDHDSNILVDFFMMYENLDKDFSELLSKLNLPQFSLLKHNTAYSKSGQTRKHYSHYYNNLTAEIVSRKYAEDIKYFNYQF
jgi:hypothetical protein